MVLQRKRHRIALKKKRVAKRREENSEYMQILAKRMKEAKERKAERKRSRSNSRRSSQGTSVSEDKKKSTSSKK